MIYRKLYLSLCVFGVLISLNTDAQAPTIDPKDDHKHLGDRNKILFWSPEEQVSGYRNWDLVNPTRVIQKGDDVYRLPYATIALDKLNINDKGVTVDDYFISKSVAGLLVIKDGEIKYERYGLGNNENSKWVSFSVAKSVTSMLIGAAIKDGFIQNVNDPITKYLPRLKGSAYDNTTIKNLLQMSSGVEWNEDYSDPKSDIATAPWKTLALEKFLRAKKRVSKAGTAFNYNTAEANLAGDLLRAAIGNNLSTYLSAKIWQPFGMESTANWMLSEKDGGEYGGCCISATLRDYGRIGLFAISQTKANGQKVLPTDWIKQSTTPATTNHRYGYFWWLTDGAAFRASGIFGQGIYINPEQNLVIALHSARADASRDEDWELQFQLFQAIEHKLRTR